MLIKVLIENSSLSPELGSEHGLSVYLETGGQKILFDVGASELFFENAKKMKVNIADVDFLAISHGHYDHGGGLKKFLKENRKAKVYLHRQAFGKYYAVRPGREIGYIGLEQGLKQNERFVFTGDQYLISPGIELYSNVARVGTPPRSASRLLMERNGQMVEDTFVHEQNLIVEEDGKTLLLAGCAHNGIVNIVKCFYLLKDNMPDYVIGGFHLHDPATGDWDVEAVSKIGEYLLSTKAKYFTGHCTGEGPYSHLKRLMGDHIDEMPAGSIILI